MLLDPSLDEILCCDAVFNIAINKINNIASCSLIKCGAFPLEILDRVYYVSISGQFDRFGRVDHRVTV